MVKYWCSPNSTTKIETLQHESSVVHNTYQLNFYERNIQFENISSKVISLLIDVVQRSLPAGVYLSIHQHEHDLHEKTRYITDHELIQYKQDLKILLDSKKDDVEDVKKKK